MTEYVETILGLSRNVDSLRVYRGHENKSYVLKPSIFRQKAFSSNEHRLLRELIASHPNDFDGDSCTLELLVRMQHYSLPTRLLDVTWNPLVALYFACQPRKRRVLLKNSRGSTTTKSVEADGAVMIIEAPEETVKYFDSDTVAILANLAKLDDELKRQIDTSLDERAFNTTLSVKRLLHLVRQERASFDPEIVPDHLESIYLVKPKKTNRRILAQDGAFFVFGVRTDFRESLQGFGINQVLIPAESKPKILSDLDLLAINEKSLFPELDRAANYLTRQMTTNSLIKEILDR